MGIRFVLPFLRVPTATSTETPDAGCPSAARIWPVITPIPFCDNAGACNATKINSRLVVIASTYQSGVNTAIHFRFPLAVVALIFWRVVSGRHELDRRKNFYGFAVYQALKMNDRLTQGDVLDQRSDSPGLTLLPG